MKLTYELRGNAENGFEGEPSPTEIEEILETRSKEFHHQGVVLAARAEVVHLRYTLYMCVMNYIDRHKSRSYPRSPPINCAIHLARDAEREKTKGVHSCPHPAAIIRWRKTSSTRKIYMRMQNLKFMINPSLSDANKACTRYKAHKMKFHMKIFLHYRQLWHFSNFYQLCTIWKICNLM